VSTEVVVALLALAGTLVGSFTGIVVANKLVNYRLEQLEKKVDQHNKLKERVAVTENEIRMINLKIQDMLDDAEKCR